jgi:lipoate-protein ligase A
MLLFQQTYDTPAENLAIDEHLLKCVDQGKYPDGICRIWESQDYFVVLGLSKKINLDVHFEKCIQDNIPILKRCSGGGTVLQGPGCFNYSYILPMSFSNNLCSLTNTTPFILNMVKTILSPSVKQIEIKGISDLVINDIKFSGNAQRRLKQAVLFHGTILYNFDLNLISAYLKEPPVQPDYRKKRVHQNFIQNINLKKSDLISLFSNTTHANLHHSDIIIEDLLLKKYKTKQT